MGVNGRIGLSGPPIYTTPSTSECHQKRFSVAVISTRGIDDPLVLSYISIRGAAT